MINNEKDPKTIDAPNVITLNRTVIWSANFGIPGLLLMFEMLIIIFIAVFIHQSKLIIPLGIGTNTFALSTIIKSEFPAMKLIPLFKTLIINK